MYDMLSPLYALLVLVNFPTIPADVKELGSDQFQVREAATARLNALPGWAVFYFKDRARIAKDQEVRLRCAIVQKALQRKWDDDLLNRKADLILALFPTIPRDIKSLSEKHGPLEERVRAKTRLDYLPGFTASYFECFARKTAKPEVRRLYERIAKRKEMEWQEFLASGSFVYMQLTLGKFESKWRSTRFWATIFSNLAKLSPEDLKLVEAQKYCPIYESGNGPDPLGCRGVPMKITLKGQTVFLCSKDCIKKAQADPDKTLTQLKRVKRLSFRTKKQLEQDLERMFNFMD